MSDSAHESTIGGRLPKSEILKKIKAAEEKVREMICTAEEQKESTLTATKREALEIRENILKEAQEANEKRLKTARAEIDIERNKILEKAEEAASAVSSVTASRINEGKTHLMDELLRAVDDQA